MGTKDFLNEVEAYNFEKCGIYKVFIVFHEKLITEIRGKILTVNKIKLIARFENGCELTCYTQCMTSFVYEQW